MGDLAVCALVYEMNVQYPTLSVRIFNMQVSMLVYSMLKCPALRIELRVCPIFFSILL